MRPEAASLPRLASGRRRTCPPNPAPREAVMAVVRGRRPMYRVYNEDDFFAEADGPADWHESPMQGALVGRRLRRLAGAAALTGAVGTVGGVIALAGFRSPLERHAAGRGMLSARAGLPRMSTAKGVRTVGHARPRRGARLGKLGALARRRSANGRPITSHQAVPATAASASGRSRPASVSSGPIDATRPARAGSSAQSASPARAPQSAPAEGATPAQVPGEFGFER
jgi:hypothetical protein